MEDVGEEGPVFPRGLGRGLGRGRGHALAAAAVRRSRLRQGVKEERTWAWVHRRGSVWATFPLLSSHPTSSTLRALLLQPLGLTAPPSVCPFVHSRPTHDPGCLRATSALIAGGEQWPLDHEGGRRLARAISPTSGEWREKVDGRILTCQALGKVWRRRRPWEIVVHIRSQTDVGSWVAVARGDKSIVIVRIRRHGLTGRCMSLPELGRGNGQLASRLRALGVSMSVSVSIQERRLD